MASIEPMMGSVDAVAFPFTMTGWASANGGLIPISQNQALFSLIGIYYGGGGTVTFALPDLQGRVAVGQGNGSGLTPRLVGEEVGQESVAITLAQMPPHEHPVSLGGVGGSGSLVASTNVAASGAAATGVAGSGLPIPTMPPSLILNYQIALNGVFPQRDNW